MVALHFSEWNSTELQRNASNYTLKGLELATTYEFQLVASLDSNTDPSCSKRKTGPTIGWTKGQFVFVQLQGTLLVAGAKARTTIIILPLESFQISHT